MADHMNELVTCRNPACKREYVCHPDDDYYNSTADSNTNGLCKKCFLEESLTPAVSPCGTRHTVSVPEPAT